LGTTSTPHPHASPSSRESTGPPARSTHPRPPSHYDPYEYPYEDRPEHPRARPPPAPPPAPRRASQTPLAAAGPRTRLPAPVGSWPRPRDYYHRRRRRRRRRRRPRRGRTRGSAAEDTR